MSKTVLGALALSLLAIPAHAQGVKITLTDGKAVTGQLEGYEQGRYRLKLPNGTVQTIDERRVQDVVLTERPAGPPPARAGASAADEARASFERGDFEDALRQVTRALADLEGQRGDLADLAGRISQAHAERLLEKRDAARLSDALRRLAPSLPAEARRALLTRLAERFADRHHAAPDDAFTAEFAQVLARLADEGTIDEALRGSLAETFVQMGNAARERKSHAAAAVLYRGAIRVDPRRREALKAPLLEGALARARALLERGEGRGAREAAREAAALDPASAEAKMLLADADLAWAKQEAAAAYGAEAAPLLREFLARATRPEHRAWAEKALAEIDAQPSARLPEVAGQMRKYFPVRPGRFLLYRRADGEIRERVRTDAVVREGEVTKVYCTLEEVYRDYSTSKAYLVEIEKDAVFMAAGTEREPLLRFPLREGDSWSWVSRGREFRRAVHASGRTVAVGPEDGRRTFEDCVEIDFTSTVEREGAALSITSRSTYAPGVGLVKLEFLNDPQLRKYNLELAEQGEASR